MQNFSSFMDSLDSPSCEDYAVWAQTYGLVIVTGATLATPIGFPGVVVGVIMIGGGLLTQSFACIAPSRLSS